MNIDNQIRQWAQIVSEDMDDELLNEKGFGSDFDVIEDGGTVTIKLPVKVDNTNSPEFLNVLKNNLRNAREMRIDLGDCQYIGSAGLYVLLLARKEFQTKNGKSIRLVNIKNIKVKEIFTMTGFDEFFTIE